MGNRVIVRRRADTLYVECGGSWPYAMRSNLYSLILKTVREHFKGIEEVKARVSCPHCGEFTWRCDKVAAQLKKKKTTKDCPECDEECVLADLVLGVTQPMRRSMSLSECLTGTLLLRTHQN